MKGTLIIVLICPVFVFGFFTEGQTKEEKRLEIIVDLISSNLKTNGWKNIICLGVIPDCFYVKLKKLYFTFTVFDIEDDTYGIDDIVPYHSNVIFLSCKNFQEFENALVKAMSSPYWHPHGHHIIYYHPREYDDIAKMFFIFWYYRICNVIVIQYNDINDSLIILSYSPYITETYKLDNHFGCRKATKIGRMVTGFQESFICEQGCQNVTTNSKYRWLNLGTCIGVKKDIIHYGDGKPLKRYFQNIAENLHGFVFTAHTVQILPFLGITENSDGTYTLYARDGLLWTTISELMNFRIDLTPSKNLMKLPFSFERNIQQIFEFSKRQVDLLLYPVYQFDIIIVEVDMSIAFRDSGVCVMSHRADYETILFDTKLLEENYDLVIQFVSCFCLIWFVFLISNVVEKQQFSLDQVGKDFSNTIRNILSISLYKPPKRRAFKIFMAVSIWSFFIINFATQAAIISFFTAFKRGKEVETFDDIIAKNYVIESLASPDMMLPETEERFLKINSRLVPLENLFGCVDKMSNDSRRFCLIDCSVGHYLASNRLNEKGEQYLHIAKDRIHSHYLNMILHKHSPLTQTFNKYLRKFFEAGLIQKWEQYKYADLKEEVPIKPLSMDDLLGIFKCYGLFVGLSSIVFIMEVTLDLLRRAIHCLIAKVTRWRRTRAIKKKLEFQRKIGEIKIVNMSTQTI